MTASSSHFRPLLIGAVALALLSQGGCAWTRAKLGMDANYQDSVQNQPLEVPPGLDLPPTGAAVTVPDVVANSRSGAPSTGVPAASGGLTAFTLADSVESSWRRIGIALGKIEGVTIGDRAQLINSYEVTYQGTVMLLRAEAAGNETRVVALGADGLPLASGAATQLLSLLKARLG